MNTIIANPIHRVKHVLALAGLSWRIRCAEKDMAFWCEALTKPEYEGHTNYINGKIEGLISEHRKLCDRRRAMGGRS